MRSRNDGTANAGKSHRLACQDSLSERNMQEQPIFSIATCMRRRSTSFSHQRADRDRLSTLYRHQQQLQLVSGMGIV
jgi:hypothetical protein